MTKASLKQRSNLSDVDAFIVDSLKQKVSMTEILHEISYVVKATPSRKRLVAYLANFLLKNKHLSFQTDDDKLEVMNALRQDVLSSEQNNYFIGTSDRAVKAKLSMMFHTKYLNAVRMFYMYKVRTISHAEVIMLCDELFADDVFLKLSQRKQSVLSYQEHEAGLAQAYRNSEAYAMEETYKNEF